MHWHERRTAFTLPCVQNISDDFLKKCPPNGHGATPHWHNSAYNKGNNVFPTDQDGFKMRSHWSSLERLVAWSQMEQAIESCLNNRIEERMVPALYDYFQTTVIKTEEKRLFANENWITSPLWFFVYRTSSFSEYPLSTKDRVAGHVWDSNVKINTTRPLEVNRFDLDVGKGDIRDLNIFNGFVNV